MNKDESLALFAQGKEAWNAWAEERLAERDALKAANTWIESSRKKDWNDETRAWHDAARVDFSEHTFEGDADFSGHIFPGFSNFIEVTCPSIISLNETVFHGIASFDRSTFQTKVQFTRARFHDIASFGETKFIGGASFNTAMFGGRTAFSQTIFKGSGGFRTASFQDEVLFGGAVFLGGAYMGGAVFRKVAGFEGAKFHKRSEFAGVNFFNAAAFRTAVFDGLAEFRGAKFQRSADFSQAKFQSIAEFRNAEFGGPTNFDNAHFERAAHFLAVVSKSGFSLSGASFLSVPNFEQAHFAEAPRLDNLRIGPERFWSGVLANVRLQLRDARSIVDYWYALRRQRRFILEPIIRRFRGETDSAARFQGDPDLAARWRALKRLAIQGHDHARELEYFKGELKARRWSEDKLWHAVFWFGVFYQILSDFGRSLLRPLLWWGLSVFLFANIYLGQHEALERPRASSFTCAFEQETTAGTPEPSPSCIAGEGEPWVAALQLSAHKGLVLPGLVPLNKLNQIYACLYGIQPQDGPQPRQLPASYTPVILDGATGWGFAQHPLSAVLIFLFLLAVRNHFRIK